MKVEYAPSERPASIQLPTSPQGQVHVHIQLLRVRTVAHHQVLKTVQDGRIPGPPNACVSLGQLAKATYAAKDVLHLGVHAWHRLLHHVFPAVEHEGAERALLEAELQQRHKGGVQTVPQAVAAQVVEMTECAMPTLKW